jgi:DNA polymerase
MIAVALKQGADIDGFRHAVRALLAAGTPPDDVTWSDATLFGIDTLPDAPPVALPRSVSELIDLVACHRDRERWALLYELIWRIRHGERHLLEVHSDKVVHRLEMMRKAIRRDLHKMHAFLRFRRSGDRFVAWFEPDHYILEATADFFIGRFRGLTWSILTPVGALHWDTNRLTLGPPGRRSDAPAGDDFEQGWCDYYASTFNPARTNPTAMRAEMPKKYWKNLPEAQAIPYLIRGADERVREMVAREAAQPRRRDPVKAVAARHRPA